MTRTTIGSLSTAACCLGVLAACSDSSGPNMRSVSLNFASRPSTAAVASFSRAAGAANIVITKAQLVLEDIELERTNAECTSEDSDADSDDSSCAELDIGPALIDLPIGSGTTQELSIAIPAGTYEEIEFELGKADASDARGAQFLQAHPEFAGVSVRVEGTFNGQPFVFVSAVNEDHEFEFDPPLTVDGTTNLTIIVDVNSWFTAAGVALDPRVSGNRSTIEARIRSSFEAFEDGDRDGRDEADTDAND